MIKLKSVIYLISMMTLAGCSGQKQASVAVEEQSGQWILGPFVRPEGVNPVISPQPTTFQCPMRFCRKKGDVRWTMASRIARMANTGNRHIRPKSAPVKSRARFP